MTSSITISLSSQTIDALKGSGSALYLMKAVKFGPQGVPFTPTNTAAKVVSPATGGGAPLIWRVVDTYLQTTSVQWDAAVQAYISTSQIADQQRITPGASTPVALGQTVNVDSSGNLSLTSGGGQGAVAIVNQGSSQWRCGLLQDVGAGLAPTCVFPLYGGMMDVMTPLDRVLLMFAFKQLTAGVVVTTAYSSGLLVDATGAQRAVSYDIDAGWSAGGASWATPVAPEQDLGALLIVTKQA